ncbi:MAG: beta-ketoacyl-ACP synthase II [Chloroflexi bacterium]|nr:beta-ketoacyl-ACP synthase II [Chloroflexota bacterium]
MPVRRVVVTGLGLVSPLGLNVDETWAGLVAGRSGIARITRFDPEQFAIKIAGEVKGFSIGDAAPPKEAKQYDRCVQYAVVATREALADSRLEITSENSERVGVIFGTGAGGYNRLLDQHRIYLERGPSRVSPMFLPHFLPDAATGVLAILYGAAGPNMAVVTACATGGTAIGEAMETIRRDDADAIIAGGTEASINPLIVAGFINMRVLADYDGPPERAAKPFDLHRNGFVLAEGSGALILEELEHAQARGARIYAEVIGYGSNNDAYHIAAPKEGGEGAIRCMRMAIRKAGIQPEEVAYINAHGSGTDLNDKYETTAIKAVFGDHAHTLSVSSTKSMVGHMMGAAGAFESIASIKAVYHDVIPPTINYETPDPECDLDYTANVARKRRVEVALSNAIGLGGHNSCVAFRKLVL